MSVPTDNSSMPGILHGHGANFLPLLADVAVSGMAISLIFTNFEEITNTKAGTYIVNRFKSNKFMIIHKTKL